jgi:hypothetical protein
MKPYHLFLPCHACNDSVHKPQPKTVSLTHEFNMPMSLSLLPQISMQIASLTAAVHVEEVVSYESSMSVKAV